MTEVRFSEHGAVPVFELSGSGPRPTAVTLVGRRARVSARLYGRGRTWRAELPLHVARWGGPVLPLPMGEYRVRIDGGDADAPAVTLPATALAGLTATWTGTRLRVGVPADPTGDAAGGAAALERRYASDREPLENAVFFESFYGRTAGCNPLAIDRELARVAPGVTRYWSVVDLSVPVPPGAVAVVEGSAAWWRARAVARLLVVNDWLRRRFVRRPGQTVLQTWHGTPLKRLALHRPGLSPRRALAVVRESRRWNVLLAQNPYAGWVLAKAYAFFRRPVWVEGYPRNDALHRDDGRGTRRALGIGADERVLLYAPTWRGDREAIVDFLDPRALARATDSVVLVRGHTRTLLPGEDARGPRVIDVTGFPDTAPLLAAADALITDYSSVMFDFSITGKPMYFLVPDLERYRGQQRGFSFDLLDAAPGPVVRTQGELERALDEVDPSIFGERYERWQRIFNARDDGRASERVVARILDQGFLDRD